MSSQTSLLLAGFGGQGILFAAKQIALAGMYHGKNVTWLPSYGPEMRGGTANCSVIISEGEIGSPTTPTPDVLIVMNLPSFIKFEKSVVPGGTIIVDSSLIPEKSARADISAHYIPATALAQENNMAKLANVIILGKLIAVTGIFTHDEFEKAMAKSIPANKRDLLELNLKALSIGEGYSS
ncbi:2-oxoglutarate ferredoxin oxidoreductase subunit gamma [Clostridia bacterium]|nr:2-oxoglutarate ferredoxin oxidoreductase subunit gamma [Clostridia bacterium]